MYNHLQNERDLWFHMTISKSFVERKLSTQMFTHFLQGDKKQQIDPAVFIRLLQPVKNPHLKNVYAHPSNYWIISFSHSFGVKNLKKKMFPKPHVYPHVYHVLGGQQSGPAHLMFLPGGGEPGCLIMGTWSSGHTGRNVENNGYLDRPPF